jgi:predicted nucleotidyltransferase component of viral defense system
MDKVLANRFADEIGIDLEQVLREWWEMLILRDIFSSSIGEKLMFKGGTALRLVYNSPRFSEDLDFSMLENFPFASFEKIALAIEKRYPELKIRDIASKFYTYLAQYRIKESWRPLAFSVKIEISKRVIDKGETYYSLLNVRSKVSNVEALGNVMNIERIYKEKTQALQTRDAPRDLFDLWYVSNFLRKPFKPLKSKFEKRELVRELRKYLPRNYWKVIDTLSV